MSAAFLRILNWQLRLCVLKPATSETTGKKRSQEPRSGRLGGPEFKILLTPNGGAFSQSATCVFFICLTARWRVVRITICPIEYLISLVKIPLLNWLYQVFGPPFKGFHCKITEYSVTTGIMSSFYLKSSKKWRSEISWYQRWKNYSLSFNWMSSN